MYPIYARRNQNSITAVLNDRKKKTPLYENERKITHVKRNEEGKIWGDGMYLFLIKYMKAYFQYQYRIQSFINVSFTMTCNTETVVYIYQMYTFASNWGYNQSPIPSYFRVRDPEPLTPWLGCDRTWNLVSPRKGLEAGRICKAVSYSSVWHQKTLYQRCGLRRSTDGWMNTSGFTLFFLAHFTTPLRDTHKRIYRTWSISKLNSSVMQCLVFSLPWDLKMKRPYLMRFVRGRNMVAIIHGVQTGELPGRQ